MSSASPWSLARRRFPSDRWAIASGALFLILLSLLLAAMNLWGLDFSHAFGGFVLYVEVIFGIPGIGRLTAETLESYDLPPIVGLAVWLALVVVLFGAIAGLIIAWLDPRTRRPAAAS